MPTTSPPEISQITPPPIAGFGDVRRRLLLGASATALNPLVSVAIQLGSVPIFLNAWGTRLYGDWLIITAIPYYIALSDFGTASAAMSDMGLHLAAGRPQSARRTFQTCWAFITIVSIAILLLTIGTAFWVPWNSILSLASTSNHACAMALIVMILHSSLCQQSSIIESGLRADSHYATGRLWMTGIRLTEAIASAAAAYWGGNIASAAVAYTITRAFANVLFYRQLCRLSTWPRFGFRLIEINTMRRLLLPSLGFIALPAAQALTIQGFTVVLGAFLGPVAVVAFSTARTLSRLTSQLATIFSWTIMPELTRALGLHQLPVAREIHRKAFTLGTASVILSTAALWTLAPRIFHQWIGSKVAIDYPTFHILLLTAAFGAAWSISAAVPMAVNRHSRLMVAYLILSTLALVSLRVVLPAAGSRGAALALLTIDTAMLALVVTRSLKLLGEPIADFLHSLSRPLSRLRRELPLSGPATFSS